MTCSTEEADRPAHGRVQRSADTPIDSRAMCERSRGNECTPCPNGQHVARFGQFGRSNQGDTRKLRRPDTPRGAVWRHASRATKQLQAACAESNLQRGPREVTKRQCCKRSMGSEQATLTSPRSPRISRDVASRAHCRSPPFFPVEPSWARVTRPLLSADRRSPDV